MRKIFLWLAISGTLLISTPLFAATILVFGDSLSSGYGLRAGEGWVDLLAKELAPQHRVFNASQTGETTDGGLSRLPHALKQYQPDIVVLELGGNDGLRGLPVSAMQHNLTAMVKLVRQQGGQVLLVGMTLPPNYGQQYIQQFQNSFVAVAKQEQVALVPLLVAGFAADLNQFQPDGIHPKAQVQRQMMNTVLTGLRPLLISAQKKAR